MADSVYLGASVLRQATVTLTNAQIIALPSTPVVVIPAVSGHVIVPSVWTVRSNITAFYTGTTDASLNLMYGTGGTVPIGLTTESASLLLNTGVRYLVSNTPSLYPGADTFAGEVLPHGQFTQAQAENVAVAIQDYWGGLSNYGGGNAANTWTVSVTYYLLNTSSGLFV